MEWQDAVPHPAIFPPEWNIAVSGNKTQAPESFSKKPHSPVAAKISEAEAREALLRSGYLIEYRIEQLLRNHGWYVEANSAYEDSESQKSRELDIFATKARLLGTSTKPKDALFSSVLIECINNPQPIAFITKKPYQQNWGVGYIKGVFDPEEVFLKHSRRSKNLGDLLKIASYHHYCQGRLASQFCSFQLQGGQERMDGVARRHPF